MQHPEPKPDFKPRVLTEAERAEAKRLRDKGWSPKGLARRYETTEAHIRAALGEKSPRQIAA